MYDTVTEQNPTVFEINWANKLMATKIRVFLKQKTLTNNFAKT